MKLRIGYVLSHGHSGSTLLGMLLGAHPEIFNIGEAAQIRPGRDVACACRTRPFSRCNVWREVEREMKASSSIDFASLALDHPDSDIFAEHNLAFLNATARVSGASLLIDSSKRRDRLVRLMALESLDIAVISLRRDPRGVVYSNVRKRRGTFYSSIRYARTLLGNASFQKGPSHSTLRYEALASEPTAELDRLFTELGLAPSATAIRLEALSSHAVGGNRMRFERLEEIRTDESWKDNLGWWDRLVIVGITAPALGLARMIEPRGPSRQTGSE